MRSSVLLDDDLAAEARALGINVPEAARQGLRQAARRARCRCSTSLGRDPGNGRTWHPSPGGSSRSSVSGSAIDAGSSSEHRHAPEQVPQPGRHQRDVEGHRSGDRRDERYRLLSGAVETLSANPATEVYIDAGHSNWHAASVTAARLRSAGVANARGFALNTSNFQRTEAEVAYGRAVSAAIGARTPFVIDTSRNGDGPISAADGWCNPPDRAVGRTPTTDTQMDLVDALLWVKVPGESDGTCRGGTSAGVFWPEYALGLVGGRRPVADSPFLDVFEGDTHAASIVRLSSAGVVSGVTPTRFAPRASVTRGQFATLCVRTLSHLDGVTPLPGDHDEALAYLLATGVVHGDANGDLRSGAPITREQAASMLVRLIDTTSSAPLPSGHHRFHDVSGTHADAVNRLAAAGIVSGGADGAFSPRSTVTRAQAATLLVRTLDLLDDDVASRHPSAPAELGGHAERRPRRRHGPMIRHHARPTGSADLARPGTEDADWGGAES